MDVTINVNGEDGAGLAIRSGIRSVQDDTQALALRDQGLATRNGRPGRDRAPAIRGGPAGALAVRLFESDISQGAIRVQRVGSDAAHLPPQQTEVPRGRDLSLTAIGGAGEAGQDGGDGQSGLAGANGVTASTVSDATDGSNGGRGGNAGRGSNGGNGGNGGSIHIIVHENNTHLLMAVKWNVSGGEGGMAGKHGQPGAGGSGGQGGRGWQWDEIVGYRFLCTDSCIRNEDRAGSSNTLSRMNTALGANSTAIVARTQSLLVSGDNLQSLITQAASRYNAMRRPIRDNGACKCGGGVGSCQGCDVKPIRKTFKRAPGLVGRDGESGDVIVDPLAEGQQGVSGTVSIDVLHEDGSLQEYTKVWELELIDIEFDDENADGIFEPGEHLFIRRVKIRNIGGMPSPTCRIPLTFVGSEWLEPVPAEDGGVDYLPSSIPPGGTASTEGHIKVRIKHGLDWQDVSPDFGSPFMATDTIAVRADVPWLERRLPAFTLTKEVEICHPCRLDSFEHLATIAQGALGRVRFKVTNIGNIAFGSDPVSNQLRTVEVRMTIPGDVGRIILDGEHTEAVRSSPIVRPNDSTGVEQTFRVLPTASDHRRFTIIFELWIDCPVQDNEDETIDMVLVERHAIHLQVSNTYSKRPNAGFLIVTNPKTSQQQSSAMEDFIRNELHAEVDMCNIHQNGGLIGVRTDEFVEPGPITSAYRNKTVIFLDDAFDFFGRGNRTTSQLCDPRWLTEMATNNCSILFLNCGSMQSVRELLDMATVPLTDSVIESWDPAEQLHLQFQSRTTFAEAVAQEKQHRGSRVAIAAVSPKPSKWYKSSRTDFDKQAASLQRYLSRTFPNERFLVSYQESQSSGTGRGSISAIASEDGHAEAGQGRLIVRTGLDKSRHVWVVGPLHPESDVNSERLSRTLDLYTRYLIVAAIPFRRRIGALWQGRQSGEFLTTALFLSVTYDVLLQVESLLIPLKPAPKVGKVEIGSVQRFFQTHLPHIHDIFIESQEQRSLAAPDTVRGILEQTLAFASSSSQHKWLRIMLCTMIQHYTNLRDVNVAKQPKSNVGKPSMHIDAVVEQICVLTETPQYIFEKGRVTTNSVVPETRCCTPAEWDARARKTRAWTGALQADMAHAKKELGSMQALPAPDDNEMELEA